MKKKTDTAPIYVGRALHKKLKRLAVDQEKKLSELCAEGLWRLVKDRNGKVAAK